MPNRAFFDNLGSILLFAFVATVFNTLALGLSIWGSCQLQFIPTVGTINLLHCFVFASLLAAVDPVAVLAVFEDLSVNEVLNIVLFGESLLNDGVSVVLYHMFETYSEIGASNIITLDILAGVASFIVVAFGATSIGIVCGLLAGFITRFTSGVRVIEPLIVFVLGYLSYLMAELFHLSGILACTFCGITMRQYVEANVSDKSRTTIKYFMKMLASVCETIIFMLLGVSTVISDHHWDTAFVLLVLVFCLIYRTMGVVIFSFFINRFRVDPLSKVDQFIMAYGGLRGAIAFSLVVLLNEDMFPNKKLFITSTLVVIYFTCFVQGATIKPLVKILNVKKDPKRKMNMNERVHIRMIDHMMGGIEDIAGNVGHNRIREQFQHISKSYLKPALLRKGHMGRGRSIMDVYRRLTNVIIPTTIKYHLYPPFCYNKDVFSQDEMKSVLSTSSYTTLSQMHVATGNGGSVSTPSMAQLFRLQRSGSRNQLASAGTCDMNCARSDGDAYFDIGSVSDVLQSRKMRDDSKIHHITDDVMFKARKKSHIQIVNHHMLPSQSQTELSGHMSDLYKSRPVLKNYRNKNSLSKPNKHSNGHMIATGKKKMVSFQGKEDNTVTVAGENSASDSDYEGITFHVNTTPENITNELPNSVESLPWKRTMDNDVHSTPAELDPGRTLGSFPAINLNDDSLNASPGKLSSPLYINIPPEPWFDTDDPVIPDNNKYATSSPCRYTRGSPALSPRVQHPKCDTMNCVSPRSNPLVMKTGRRTPPISLKLSPSSSSEEDVFECASKIEMPVCVPPHDIYGTYDRAEAVEERISNEMIADDENDFRLKHAAIAISRGSIEFDDQLLINDTINSYRINGADNLAFIQECDNNNKDQVIINLEPEIDNIPSIIIDAQDNNADFRKACSNCSETSL